MKFLEQFALILVLLVIFVAAAFWQFKQDVGIKKSYFIVEDAYKTPAISLKNTYVGDPLYAVLVHGFSGSKEIMMMLALALARSGVTCYLIDLPGHGDSSQRFRPADMVTATRSAIDYLEAKGLIKRNKTALVGHSMGAYIALELARGDRSFAATVAISPLLTEVGDQTPRNLLFLVGGYDLWPIKEAVRNMIALATQDQYQGNGNVFGDFSKGTARRLDVFPKCTHTTILFSPAAYRAIVAWLSRCFNSPLKASAAKKMLLVLSIQFVALFALFFPWSAILCYALDNIRGGIVFQSNYNPNLSARSYVIYFSISVVLSITLLKYGIPFSFIHLVVGDYLLSFLFISSVVVSLFLIRKKQLVAAQRRILFNSILTGIVLFWFLYLLFGRFLGHQFVHLKLTLHRDWRMIVLFVFMLPFFLIDEAFARNVQASVPSPLKGYLLSVSLSFLNKALVLGLLFLAISFRLGGSYGYLWMIGLFTPWLLFLSLLLQVYSAYIFSRTHNFLVTGTFNAASLAWIFSAAFITI